MSTPTPFTRREFLHTGLGLVSTAATVPGFLANAGHVFAAASDGRTSLPGVAQDRVLVVVQLSGGNDGLNTIVPFGMDAYYDMRPTIAIDAKDVHKIDHPAGLGLAPNLTGLRDMLDDGLMAVQLGVGYPNPNRSHFASTDIWHTGDALPNSGGTGWVGRSLDAARAAGATANGLECVSIGSTAPMAVQGEQVKPVAFSQANLFRWTAGDIHSSLTKAYDAQLALTRAADQDSPAAFIHRTACDANIASDRVRKAVSRKPGTKFPNSALSRQLQHVASMITAELPTRVYYVTMGGFDTHAAQGNRHPQLMAQFSQGMKAFYDELKATGHDGRVVTLAFSEFGRRVRQNASAGTDHGAAGPTFVFGPAVKPGVHGEHPSLSDLDKGDLKFHTDFRSIYTELMQDWMQIRMDKVFGATYAPTQLLSKKS